MKTLYIQPHPDISQHFWHFMMGEFLPIVYIILKYKYDQVFICKSQTKCKFPLNSFYQEVATDFGFDVSISPNRESNKKYITPKRWDWHFYNEQQKLLWVVRRLKQWAGTETHIPIPKSKSQLYKPLMLVQCRKNTNVLNIYYREHGLNARRQRYGEERRQVTNMESVASTLKQLKHQHGRRVIYTVPDGSSLKKQINQYIQADTLVLGHGAGMVHVLWMMPHSLVVEIIPEKEHNEINGAVQGCPRLCNLMGFKIRRIVVAQQHCAVNVAAVVHHVTSNTRRKTRKSKYNNQNKSSYKTNQVIKRK